MNRSLTFLCVCCDFKGVEFLEAVHGLGHRVYLVTTKKTMEDPWPRQCLEDIFYVPEDDGRKWDMHTVITGTAYLFKHTVIDRIVALDDYDVRKVAELREEFRLPGMGQTTARHFFDKLAMRMVAREFGIPVPDFSALFNDEQIRAFFKRSSGPYIVKPRSDAGALGIRKLADEQAFWEWSEQHSSLRHAFLIETFKPGDVYHVDALFTDYQPHFMRASKYLQTPFEVAHSGGIFRSRTLAVDDPEHDALAKLNEKLLKAFGLRFGASHSEFIRSSETGDFIFLETSARVGGAHLSDMVEAASGINLWREWARIEVAELMKSHYEVPEAIHGNAGIAATLSRFEYPDYGPLEHPAVCWKMNKKYHVGLIVKDDSTAKVEELLDYFSDRFMKEYHATIPLKE